LGTAVGGFEGEADFFGQGDAILQPASIRPSKQQMMASP
jgi:hypothetical protein